MRNYSLLLKTVKSLGCTVLENEPMKNHTTFEIGGNADLFVFVENKAALKSILSVVCKEDIPYFVLGKGSNILVSDKGIRGVVLYLCGEFSKIELIDERTIRCGSSVNLAKLCSFAQKNSLSGLEFAWGIPGSAGGAAYMNAGAYSGEMKDVLLMCEHVTNRGEEGAFKGENLDLSYRHSVYTDKDFIITAITIKLKKYDPSKIKERMDDYISRRKAKQPLEYPSAGSVFKRPEGHFAGELIQRCNLRGININDAYVSEKHAGFIINKGNATCEDVLNLIKLIQSKVKSETGVSLECEVKAVGEF